VIGTSAKPLHLTPSSGKFKIQIMKKTLFLALVISLVIVSCTKDNTDNTIGWVGTYTSSVNRLTEINRVVISRVDNNTLQVQLQFDTLSYVWTIATAQKAAIVNSATLAINENDTIAGCRDSTFNFVASGALSGNNLIMTGSATNIATPADVKGFYFSGSK
jgi:hypothetical protein